MILWIAAQLICNRIENDLSLNDSDIRLEMLGCRGQGRVFRRVLIRVLAKAELPDLLFEAGPLDFISLPIAQGHGSIKR